jgi:hypothetical protein
MKILEGIPFGDFYFEVAVILRNSLLVSSLLSNSEAWYNVTKSELDYLETVDLMLLRNILKAPKSTPKEMLYLELGCIPFREIIRKRRLSFLFYILHEDTNSMVYRFFETQLRDKTSKDWVLQDLEDLQVSENFEDIKVMKKSTFMRMIKQKVEEKAFKYLENLKTSHSKVMKIKHTSLKMQKYLKPNALKISQSESQLIFKLRCRVTDVKVNMKGIYDTYECNLCKKEEESQEHILTCIEIRNMKSDTDSMIKYDNLFNGKVNDQVEIARVFKENTEIKERILNKK